MALFPDYAGLLLAYMAAVSGPDSRFSISADIHLGNISNNTAHRKDRHAS